VRSKYYPPKYAEEGFHCPHCAVYSHHVWFSIYRQNKSEGVEFVQFPDLWASACLHCGAFSYWFKQRLIEPAETSAELAHPDMPDDCKAFFEEARQVFPQSPRGAAALLRLVVQMLCKHFGGKGEKIDDDIAGMVKNGLPVLVQKALDYCRVVGNNAVHPGEIVIEDNAEIAQQLFGMINFIVEDRITRPNEIEALYSGLPEGARDAIDRRDGK
jgi:hypothetical protein